MKASTVKTPAEIFAVIGKSGVVRIRNTRQMAIRAAQYVIQKYVRNGEPEIAKRKGM